MQLMSKVPNWGFCGLCHLDFIDIRAETDLAKLRPLEDPVVYEFKALS